MFWEPASAASNEHMDPTHVQLPQTELRVAREKGRRRGALAARQESELAARGRELAAAAAAEAAAQRASDVAAEDRDRIKVPEHSLACTFQNASVSNVCAGGA